MRSPLPNSRSAGLYTFYSPSLDLPHLFQSVKGALTRSRGPSRQLASNQMSLFLPYRLTHGHSHQAGGSISVFWYNPRSSSSSRISFGSRPPPNKGSQIHRARPHLHPGRFLSQTSSPFKQFGYSALMNLPWILSFERACRRLRVVHVPTVA
ncbi:hypothetical protein B0F90DRAFT_247169 [Multifurca ochricompacta]|uniref:Uncharacterized protein n=1 Tax=Multifurca ochricompacta TaxID=376703 RepID=A0AAD4M4I9_9AGAM|nr:hypothetical protein B0F90DRAFT_247169 [Multifurca ochricompacta]